MRALRAAEIGLRAERLRLVLFVRRLARRGVLAGCAALGAAMLVLMLHLAAAAALALWLPVWLAALAVASFDALVAFGCLWLAVRSRPGQAEREAAELGREARAELRQFSAAFGLGLEAARAATGRSWLAALASVVASWLLRRPAAPQSEAPPPG